MKTLILYYSVSNGGDGSATPEFTTSKEVADIHQEIVNFDEGWGEPCTGSIKLTSESEIKVDKNDLINVEEMKERLEEIAENDGQYYASGTVKKAKKLLERLNEI